MLSEALLCFGASSTSIEELGRTEHLDKEIFISSIFTGDQDLDRCISKAADSIGLDDVPPFEITTGEDCDWVKNSQEMFHPVNVTDDIWTIPAWRTPPNIHATNIILNPGLAFGTGEHPTTKLCLLLLHGLVKGGEKFLDYGTGSGVLSIAALKLGAALSVGVDIDPQAITSARQNAALNDIQPDKMHLYLGSRMVSLHSPDGHMVDDAREHKEIYNEKEKFDIVIANILLNPLIELADHIADYAKPGGVIGISGILSEQVSQIEECYSKYVDNIIVSHMDGWACVKAIKKVQM
ncbi:uncharacterized protein [Aristolochia californica]|uniref:uncharacterized protein n=1 Tax=Aristolochia californica TaxID=171875 RepID=UPI0035D7AC92